MPYRFMSFHWHTKMVRIDGEVLEPIESVGIMDNGVRGFNWGYIGAAPEQLALALLLKYTDTKMAVQLYKQFTTELVQHFPQDDFVLTDDVVTTFLRRKLGKAQVA